MTAHALDTEYENAVADVLAAVMGDRATVRRNVKMPGHKTKRTRQIYVLVEGDLFGAGNAKWSSTASAIQNPSTSTPSALSSHSSKT